MKKAETTNCPKCDGKGWERHGRMTLYYESGRMRTAMNCAIEERDSMEELSVYKKSFPHSLFFGSQVSAEQAKIDSTDYLKRKTMESCSLCKGKKILNKEDVIMMKLRGEV